MKWEGIFNYLKNEYYLTRKNKFTKNLLSLFSPKECSICHGSGLKQERLTVKLAGKSIFDIKSMHFLALENWLISNSKNDEIDGKLIAQIQPFISKTIKRAEQLHKIGRASCRERV